MLGLVYLFIGSIYLALSVWVVLTAMREAQKRAIAKWKWGVPAGVVMYLLVFWDHIPTVVVHQYYCHKEAGFAVYKTLEEWKRENPGVAETLTYEDKVRSEIKGNKTIYYMNERFDFVVFRLPVFLSIKRHKQQVVDKLNNDILAEYIDFSSGGGFQNANSLTDYKLWLAINTCDKGRKNRTLFQQFKNILIKSGGKES